MNASPLMIARLALLLAGIAAFAYSLNTGDRRMQYVAIGCIVATLALRLFGRFKGRQ